jgi:hypothetical protein
MKLKKTAEQLEVVHTRVSFEGDLFFGQMAAAVPGL